MRHRVPTPIDRLRKRKARIIEPSFVEIFEASIRPCGPDDLRHGVSEEAVSFRAFTQSGGDLCFLQFLLYPKLFRDVPVDTDHTQRLTGVILDGHLRGIDDSDHTVACRRMRNCRSLRPPVRAVSFRIASCSARSSGRTAPAQSVVSHFPLFKSIESKHLLVPHDLISPEIPIPHAGAGHLGSKLEPMRGVLEGHLRFPALGDVLDQDDDADH